MDIGVNDILKAVESWEMLNHLPYTVKWVMDLGYIVERNHIGDTLVKDENWVKENYQNIENCAGIVDGKPLIYIKDVPVKRFNINNDSDKDKRLNLFYLGDTPARVSVEYGISDKDPRLRFYSNSLEKLNGKVMEGTLQSVNVEINTVRDPAYAYFYAVINYTGDVERYYENHALHSEAGTISHNSKGDIVFTSKRMEDFCRYRSGCGHAEHYIVPGSDYRKYVETSAIIPKEIGGKLEILHTVADDPKYLLEQKLKSCQRNLHINTLAEEWADSDGMHSETVSDINFIVRQGSDDKCFLKVTYIPDEHKNKHKAVEYEVETSVSDFIHNLQEKELADNDALYNIAVTAKEVIEDAKKKGFEFSEEFLKNFEKAYEDIEEKNKDIDEREM